VETRWNSTHDMLEVALEFSSAIDAFFAPTPKFHFELLTSADWTILVNMLDILAPFKKRMVALQGEKYVTSSLAPSIMANLLMQLVTHFNKFPKFENVLDKAFNKLQHYWTSPLHFAYVLDPRFFGLTDVLAPILRKTFLEGLCKEFPITQPSPANDLKAETKDTLLQEVYAIPSLPSEAPKNEVDLFLEEKRVEFSVNVLNWWKGKEKLYPQLAKAAKKYLCIQATSAPCERLFSTAGYLTDGRRAAMSPNTLKAYIVVGDNKDLV